MNELDMLIMKVNQATELLQEVQRFLLKDRKVDMYIARDLYQAIDLSKKVIADSLSGETDGATN